MVTYKMRKDYFFTTLSLFLTALVIYGSIGLLFPDENRLINHDVLQFLCFGGIGGFGFGGMLSGIILFARFIAKKSLGFKILCSCLFFFTFAFIVYFGMLTLLPYGIYNLIMMVKQRKTGVDTQTPPPQQNV